MKIRALELHEAALHREVRLRALRDAPESFGESAEDLEARPYTYWEQLTRSVTAGQVMFLACEGDAVHGATYGLRDAQRSNAGRVGGTWVAPSHRRRGIGTALLQAVKSWAGEQGFGCLRLWAPATSGAALSLYRHAGFRETGQRRPMPRKDALQIVEMECELP
ncbi:MAG TPA: GNAT family N-acetyltransferase [Burkholderiales bacterium]|nr:GNAT family N-acetyltransferase [Burkholderiales bacterium]